MATFSDRVPILMFHSISNGTGPTCIAPDVFAEQMAAIKTHEWTVVSLTDVQKWHAGMKALPEKSLAITFDDGFTDFLIDAQPLLERMGFPSTMFVPTERTGGVEDWGGAHDPARTVMDWPTLQALDQTLVDIAPHSRTHADLTALSKTKMIDEVAGSKTDMEEKLGRRVRHFAPPYGRSNQQVLNTIGKHYGLSVGVDFGLASKRSNLLDLPRIEMCYYQNLDHWNQFLTGQGRVYLAGRQVLRKVGQMIRPKVSAAVTEHVTSMNGSERTHLGSVYKRCFRGLRRRQW